MAVVGAGEERVEGRDWCAVVKVLERSGRGMKKSTTVK